MIIAAFILLTLLVALGLSAPWWRRAAPSAVSQQHANVAVYRARQQEIEQELQLGSLSTAAAASLRQELQARLLREAGAAETSQVAVRGFGPLWLLLLFLPAFAGVWYWQGASWQQQKEISLARHDPKAAQAMAIESMVDKLSQRLKAKPDDAEGWAILGRSYFVLNRYPESAEAYASANKLIQPAQPELLIAEGAALGMAREGDLAGKPRELFKTALKLQPDHPRGLWFAGQAALQAGDFAEAQNLWEQLLKQELPDELRTDLKARVQELAARTGKPVLIAAPKPAAADAGAARLQLVIDIDPQLRAHLAQLPTLFVFAKAARGPPMPLAVQKLPTPRTWPLTLKLDDSMAMSPALRLSSFDAWVVTARLSASGTPQAQSGDWQAQLSVDRAQSSDVIHLKISEQIP